MYHLQSVVEMAGEHMVYLTSMGCLDAYPENRPCRFINRLGTPIVLSNDIEYEAGLVSVMYPIQYYAVIARDEQFRIVLHTRYHSSGDRETVHEYKYTPNINMLAGDMQRLVTALNDDLTRELKVYLGDRFAKFVRQGRIFMWDDTQKRCSCNMLRDPHLGLERFERLI